MKERFAEDLNNYREALKTNTQNFEAEAKQAINTAGASAGTAPLGELASSMQAWKNQNYLWKVIQIFCHSTQLHNSRSVEN